MRRGWLLPCALLALAASPAGADAGAYRVRIPIRTGAGAAVQRLALPGAVLAAAQRPDLADVRVFDAAGRAMPIARVAADATPRRTVLRPMPILAPSDGLAVRGLSLTLDDDGGARVAQVSGTPVRGGGARLVGVLLDARRAGGGADALILDAVVPEGQPVTLAAEASRDLSAWRPLGQRTLYRTPGIAPAPLEVPLAGAALRGDYLRVTWSARGRLLSSVAVRSATLIGLPAAAAPRSVAAGVPPLRDPHAIEVAVPFATPIRAIRATPTGGDLVVPIRILGRDTDEARWTLLGRGVATRGGADIVLNGAAVRTLRIEADERTPGFTAPPSLRFGFAARDLLFLAAGRPPFTLAAGRAGAADVALPADSLMRAGDGAVGRASTADTAQVLQLSAPDGGTRALTLLLWAVLLAATALLACFAWLVWRRGAAPAGTEM